MAVGLEDVEDLLRFTEVADPGLLSAVADGHGAEDDIDRGFLLGCHSAYSLQKVRGLVTMLNDYGGRKMSSIWLTSNKTSGKVGNFVHGMT